MSVTSTRRPSLATAALRGRAIALHVSADQLGELRRLEVTPELRHGHRRRVQVILLTVQGLGSPAIAARVGLSAGQVSRIRARFRRGGVESLAERPRSGRGNGLGIRQVQELLALATSPPPRGSARWSLALLATTLGLGRSVVYKVLRRNAVPPWGQRGRH